MKRRFAVLFLLVAASSRGQQATTDRYRGGVVTPPLPKPAFTLTDTSGKQFAFSEKTHGYVTLLFFGYTFCPDQCPLHMATIGAALKKLPRTVADQVRMVFVTTDPARDTRQVLRRWLDSFDPRFIGLTGTEQEIAAVQRVTGVPAAQKSGSLNGSYGVAHANFVLVYSRDNLAHLIYPGGVSKDDWAHDLLLLLNENWSGR